MIVLRDPQATSLITDSYIRDLVALRWTQVLAGESYDYDRHGYMVVVESGDTVEQLEQEIGLPILHGLFDDVSFGHPDFVPCTEAIEEFNNGKGNTVFEATFITSDDGAGSLVFIPAKEGIPADLLAMCRSFATPAMTCD